MFHWEAVQSRCRLPLSTCQNKGFPRVFSPLTRRQSWLTSGYQRGFWPPEIPPNQRLKTVARRRFSGKMRAARLLSQTGGSVALRRSYKRQSVVSVARLNLRLEAGRRAAASDGNDVAP